MLKTKLKPNPPLMVFIFLLLLFGYNNCGIKTSDQSGGSNNSSSSNGGGGGVNPTPTPLPAGMADFNNVVLPMMNTKCISCHNDPRFGGKGPLTIYNYSYMKGLMGQGANSVNNNLINKVQNIIAHDGGNQCISGLLQSPCKEFVDWWQLEFTQSSSGITGNITVIDPLGNVTGYAQDVNHPTNTITVYAYIDGPVGTGTAAGTYTANAAGAGTYAGHYFTFQLPATAADGKQHSLYMYGSSPVASSLLPGSPKVYYAYTPRTAGMNYFNSTLLPKLNACVGCHGSLTYSQRYTELIAPTPDQGGTSMNNLLINKASGGNSHSGGNICGSKNNSPCLEMQQWWTLEFN